MKKIPFLIAVLLSSNAFALGNKPKNNYNTQDARALYQSNPNAALPNPNVTMANQAGGFQMPASPNPYTPGMLPQGPVPERKPAVVCRSAGCTRINDKITKEFLFNSMIRLLWNNEHTKVYMCEADPHSRACLANSIGFGAQIGSTPAVVTIPSYTLEDIKYAKNLKSVNMLFNYDMLVNGIKPNCTSAYNSLDIISSDEVIIKDNTYQCQLTSDVPSEAFATYNIDYIDTDYGILGGYYSIGLSGPSQGGGTGYMLMKLSQKAEEKNQFDESFFTESDNQNLNVNIQPGEYEVIPLETEE
jgi:hypothetical protein